MAISLVVIATSLCGIVLIRSLRLLCIKWQHSRRIAEHGCQPARTLVRNPWLFGFDVVYDMVAVYNAGSRNMQLYETHVINGATFRTTASRTARIFTIDPANLKAVFGGRSDDWGVAPVRFDAFRPFISGGVLIVDGAAWRHSRIISQSIIDRMYRHYSSDLSTFDKNINSLLARIPDNGSTVDLQPLLYQYTMDSSTENIFGERIGALLPGNAGEYGRNFLDSFIYCLTMAGERDEVPQWNHMIPSRKFRRACRVLHQYADHNIRRALQLCEKDSEWARTVTDMKEARNQILNVIAASFDTIAILMTNTFFHLARNPDMYAKLREEVMNFDETLNSQNLKSLTYLHYVLNESLRLNGPASFNSRVALNDCVIPRGGGPDGTCPVFVPQGDIVIVSAFALQRQTDVYGQDPHQFEPERWKRIQPKNWNFIPFSAGSRTCPGQKFALMHGAYLLFSLVRKFKTIENRDPVEEFVEEYRIATGSKNGAQVALWS